MDDTHGAQVKLNNPLHASVGQLLSDSILPLTGFRLIHNTQSNISCSAAQEIYEFVGSR